MPCRRAAVRPGEGEKAISAVPEGRAKLAAVPVASAAGVPLPGRRGSGGVASLGGAFRRAAQASAATGSGGRQRRDGRFGGRGAACGLIRGCQRLRRARIGLGGPAQPSLGCVGLGMIGRVGPQRLI